MALENNGIPIVTLIYVNSAMNPVLYTILSHNFRSKCQFVRRRIQRVYRTQKRNSHAVLMLSGHKVSSVQVTTAYFDLNDFLITLATLRKLQTANDTIMETAEFETPS